VKARSRAGKLRSLLIRSKYHVFLTGYDDFELRVSERTPAGFRVQAKDDSSTGAFSWRAVAKRKDIPAPRFETVTVPHEPVLPALPDESVAPAPRHFPSEMTMRDERC
jgi:hypothetical protein